MGIVTLFRPLKIQTTFELSGEFLVELRDERCGLKTFLRGQPTIVASSLHQQFEGFHYENLSSPLGEQIFTRVFTPHSTKRELA